MTPEHKALVAELEKAAQWDDSPSKLLHDAIATIESPSAQCAQPANPAQVTELIADLEQAVIDFENASSATYNRSKAELVKAREVLTAAIGAGVQAVAEARKLLLWAADSFDACAKGTKVCDEVEGYEESAKMYRECASRLSALSKPHPADERVAEALERAAEVADARAMRIKEIGDAPHAVATANSIASAIRAMGEKK